MTSETPVAPVAKRELPPLVFLYAIAAINLGGPFLPVPNVAAAIVGGIVLTLAYVAVVIGFGLSIAKKQYPILTAAAFLGLSALVWVGVQYLLMPWVTSALIQVRAAGGEPTESQQLLYFCTTTLQDLAMISGACFAGTILSRLIRHPNMLVPIGAAIALIDIWGVLFGGIVSQLLTNKATQPIAEKAMAAGPRLGPVRGMPASFRIEIPSIGVGDFLFIALLLSVVINLGMNWKTSSWLMWGFVSGALLSIVFLPFVPHLPGLLFIAAAVILPNLKYSRFTREEQFALLYAGIFVLVLTVGLYFGFKAMLPTKI